MVKMKVIYVTPTTHAQLQELKLFRQQKNIDEVITGLLKAHARNNGDLSCQD